MAIKNQESTIKSMKKKYLERRSSRIISFSAKLPDDVSTSLQEYCICAVKYSTNPSSEIRESIVEMIEKVGIGSWKEMEELIYCYIALNSVEVHDFIEHAFLSLRLTSTIL